MENFQIKVPKNHLKTNNMNNLDNTTFMQETTSSTHLLLERRDVSHTKKTCGNNAWSTNKILKLLHHWCYQIDSYYIIFLKILYNDTILVFEMTSESKLRLNLL